MNRSLAARAAIAALLLLVLGAPGPGHVGSCSDSTDAAADPEVFCRERKGWICARLRLAGGDADGDPPGACAGAPAYEQSQFDDCRARIPTDCSGARFAADCTVTERQTAACVEALSLQANVCIPEEMIAECRFCTR